jgi:hypothetical protein
MRTSTLFVTLFTALAARSVTTDTCTFSLSCHFEGSGQFGYPWPRRSVIEHANTVWGWVGSGTFGWILVGWCKILGVVKGSSRRSHVVRRAVVHCQMLYVPKMPVVSMSEFAIELNLCFMLMNKFSSNYCFTESNEITACCHNGETCRWMRHTVGRHWRRCPRVSDLKGWVAL